MLNDGLRFHGAVCAYDQIRHIANMASLRMLEAMMLVGRIKMPTGRFEIPMFDRVLMYMEPMLTWCEAGCGDLHLHPVIGLLQDSGTGRLPAALYSWTSRCPRDSFLKAWSQNTG